MKKSIIYLAISATLTFSGCDYLDDMPYDWAQPDDIFTNEQNYLKPINQVYAYIPEGFNHVGNAFLDAATNDGISTIIDSDIHKLSRGYVTSSNPIEECWNKSYKGIQQAIFARKYLREADLVLQNKTEEDIQTFKDTYCAETECLQALFEFTPQAHLIVNITHSLIVDFSAQGGHVKLRSQLRGADFRHPRSAPDRCA